MKWIKIHVVKCEGEEMGKISPNFVCLAKGFEQDITALERE